ncbi:MAG: prefoldin subunit beta [Nitrososphaeria archaeon]|nr:prefoldin subunit beta [Nitrososphaeria archaeon]
MSEEIPAWLRERLARFEEMQRSLQAVQIQKRQIDLENSEIERALDELKKTSPEDAIYKFSGQILIKVNKDELVKELEEKLELNKTRISILAKQEEKLKQSLTELQSKISSALSGQPGALRES